LLLLLLSSKVESDQDTYRVHVKYYILLEILHRCRVDNISGCSMNPVGCWLESNEMNRQSDLLVLARWFDGESKRSVELATIELAEWPNELSKCELISKSVLSNACLLESIDEANSASIDSIDTANDEAKLFNKTNTFEFSTQIRLTKPIVIISPRNSCRKKIVDSLRNSRNSRRR